MTKTDRCLVCNNYNLEKLLSSYSRYYPKMFRNVAICTDCGHIQLHPLYEKEEYELINSRFFGAQYMVDGQENQKDNNKKLKKLDSLLSPQLRDNLRILDVGAGEAWAMNYFHSKGCRYYAIETVDRLAQSITNRGGKVIGKTIFDDYAGYRANFDIIIFRHILEHLLNPEEALRNLKSMLSPDGLIYLALPNAGKPTLKKGFKTSFIRPVHVSYFCLENVLRLSSSAGLYPIYSDAAGEIVCLLKNGDKKRYHTDFENYYSVQKNIFLKKGREAFKKDANTIAKDLIKTMLLRLVKVKK